MRAPSLVRPGHPVHLGTPNEALASRRCFACNKTRKIRAASAVEDSRRACRRRDPAAGAGQRSAPAPTGAAATGRPAGAGVVGARRARLADAIRRVLVVVRPGEHDLVAGALRPHPGARWSSRAARAATLGVNRAAGAAARDRVRATTWVAIHDGARPFAAAAPFEVTIAAAHEHGGRSLRVRLPGPLALDEHERSSSLMACRRPRRSARRAPGGVTNAEADGFDGHRHRGCWARDCDLPVAAVQAPHNPDHLPRKGTWTGSSDSRRRLNSSINPAQNLINHLNLFQSNQQINKSNMFFFLSN